MNEDERALRTVELWLAKNRQAEANCNRTEANFRKAEVALQKFRARGPHKKQKPGRPGFWKSPAGLLFVREVDSVREKRNCSIAFAIKTVKLKAIRWSRWYQARAPRDLIMETVKRLARTSCSALQVRYQEARRYWSFLLRLPVVPKRGRGSLSEISTKRFQRGVKQLMRGQN